MYPRDNDWKKLITKHRRDIDALRRGKDLPKKVEDELMQWALKNGEIKSDDVDELDDFIDDIINEGTVNENPERTPAVKAARKAHKAGTWDGNVDKEGNPIVHLKGKPYTVVMENYAQDLDLAQKNVARLSQKETGQDKKDYQAVARALNQGNLGAVKKVIKGISTKEIQADILNILVGYNDLIAKMYPKAAPGGRLKTPMSVDKMINEDEEDILINEALVKVTDIEVDYGDQMPKKPMRTIANEIKLDWDLQRSSIRAVVKKMGGLITGSEPPSIRNKWVGTLTISTRGDPSKLDKKSIQKAVIPHGIEIHDWQFKG